MQSGIKDKKMTTIQSAALNAEILRNLGSIAESESMLNRVAKYLRKLKKEKDNDPTLLTKEEFFSRLDQAERDIADGKGITFHNLGDMNKWLNEL